MLAINYLRQTTAGGAAMDRGTSCRILVCLLLLAGLLLQPSCSSEFVYNRVDRIAQFYIKRYVDLDRDQSQFLKVNLESIKQWHRREELQGYRDFLNTVESDLQQDISGATVAGWVDYLRQAYNDIRDKVLPPMIEVAGTLTTAQVEELAANMEKRNREQEKEYLTRDDTEYRKSAFDEMDDRLSGWLGRLTTEQKQRLQSAVSGLERLDRQWLDGRRAWQKQVIGELQRQPGWQARLTALVNNRSEYTQARDIAANHRNEQRIYAAVADVLNMRTDRQRRKLLEKLHDYQKDLAALQNYPHRSG